MPDSDPITKGEAEARALRLAEQRGRESANIDARLDEHERHLKAINGSITSSANELHALKGVVNELKEVVANRELIATTRNEEAEKRAKTNVTTREFVMGIIALILSLGMLLVATGQLGR